MRTSCPTRPIPRNSISHDEEAPRSSSVHMVHCRWRNALVLPLRGHPHESTGWQMGAAHRTQWAKPGNEEWMGEEGMVSNTPRTDALWMRVPVGGDIVAELRALAATLECELNEQRQDLAEAFIAYVRGQTIGIPTCAAHRHYNEGVAACVRILEDQLERPCDMEAGMWSRFERSDGGLETP